MPTAYRFMSSSGTTPRENAIGLLEPDPFVFVAPPARIRQTFSSMVMFDTGRAGGRVALVFGVGPGVAVAGGVMPHHAQRRRVVAAGAAGAVQPVLVERFPREPQRVQGGADHLGEPVEVVATHRCDP